MKDYDDPMRVGDEDYRTPAQQFTDVMRDLDCIFSGRPLPQPTPADEQARLAYWRRVLQQDSESLEDYDEH